MTQKITIDRLDFALVIDYFGLLLTLKESNRLYDKCFPDEDNITHEDLMNAGNIIKQECKFRYHSTTISDRLSRFITIYTY